jgi:large subunit ribosomal protein L21
MFAVIKTGGKQYKVAKDDVLVLERLDGAEGDTVSFGEVLMMGSDADVTIGAPMIEGAQVQAELLETRKGKKITVFKMKRRKNYRRTKGHRQMETVVRITDILAKGAKPAAKKPAAKKAAPKKEAAPKKAAPKKAAAKSDAKDDLKKISGVGPVLEKKLNALGLNTYADIASLTKAQIADVDEKLSFKGRIEREGWLDQAAKLDADK